MEPQYSKVLPYKHISEATNEILQYIEDRRLGRTEPLKTRWKKFNKICGGGIEKGSVYTIVGASGSGKSSFVNLLESDLIELNPNKDVIVLSFSFEMLSNRQVGRKLSNVTEKTTYDLYSAERRLSDEEFKQVLIAAEKIKKFPIYYVDTPADVEEITNTIKCFQETLAKDKWLVITLDHTLLIKGKSEEAERIIIKNLQNAFISAKKVGCTSIIQISQMNRNIESPDRINNPSCHYPMRSDISSADSVFQGSDVVAVIARPEIIGIRFYGPNQLPVSNRIYLHILKNRDGNIAILEFMNDLAHNNIIEPEQKETKEKEGSKIK